MAGHRTELYYNGVMSSVSMDNVNALATHGTDVIFAEKQDAIEAFGYYADMFGLSMVDTHGHLTEYAKDLVRAFDKSGASPSSFTDMDAGIAIALGLDMIFQDLGSMTKCWSISA